MHARLTAVFSSLLVLSLVAPIAVYAQNAPPDRGDRGSRPPGGGGQPQTRPAPGGNPPGDGNRPGGPGGPGGGNRPGGPGGNRPQPQPTRPTPTPNPGNRPSGGPGGNRPNPGRPDTGRPQPDRPNPGRPQPGRPNPGRPQPGRPGGRPPQWGRPPQNRPSYSFRPNDRDLLRRHYLARLRYINRARRPIFTIGGYFPYGDIGYLSPLPVSLYGTMPPPPPGYQMGYYDGYVVVYDPITYFIANVVDLLQ